MGEHGLDDRQDKIQIMFPTCDHDVDISGSPCLRKGVTAGDIGVRNFESPPSFGVKKFQIRATSRLYGTAIDSRMCASLGAQLNGVMKLYECLFGRICRQDPGGCRHVFHR